MWIARAAASLVCVAGLSTAAPVDAQPPVYTERVEVSRLVIDAHVLEDDGRPVRGLQREHFRVLVDGQPARVLDARWTSDAVADRRSVRDAAVAIAPDPPAAQTTADTFGIPRGRLIVFLFQKDLEPTRIEGLMRMLRWTRTLLDSLRPDDRVAVLSFDFRLRFWHDFTDDRATLHRMFERSILMDGPPPAGAVTTSPSLALYYDRRAAQQAVSMEQALLVVARALNQVPGSKSLVIIGHGFGRLNPLLGASHTMSFDREYGQAQRLFLSGRTTVYCLDTTQAAAHSLEAGLMQVAADTGGFFLRTHEFPESTIRRLGDALSGRYELSVETPALPQGEHRITVELIGRKGLVLARRSYVG
jgi:VWFA-related protein